jgi:bacteriocin-like protein
LRASFHQASHLKEEAVPGTRRFPLLKGVFVKKNMADLAKIDELAVEVLSDEELEAVTGGLEAAAEASASCSCCTAGATVITKTKVSGS